MKLARDEIAIVDSTRVLVARAKKLQAESNSSSWGLADIYAELKNQGWTQDRIARECQVGQPHVSKFIRCAEKYSLVNTRPPFWEAFREVNERAVHVSQNTGQPEWYTPADFIEAARRVLGEIDLDPASSEKAQGTVRAHKFYTAKDDGLSKDWEGRVWLNPPYTAGLVDKFVMKLCHHLTDGSVPAAVLLVNDAMETSWMQHAAKFAAAMCFPDRRIRFLNEQGEPVGAPLQGQTLAYFGDAVDKFRTEFKPFGFRAGLFHD